MQDSIFTKIIKGEIPAHKVYEDEASLAFLDIHPVQPGHVLVVPKKQVAAWQDLDEDTYLKLMKTVRIVGKRIKQVLQPEYVGIRIVGVDVPHVHVHLIPFSTLDEFNQPQDMSSEPDHIKLKSMANKLAL
ncbi:MAG TPA: HIT family protein [Candidatus Saccharimonadales bacterium]|nr:HIT family protein [Candidatus Saccharimonadales bacterium]